MAYFKDMSEYEYGIRDKRELNTYNIGWLDESNRHSKGALSDCFLNRLWDFIIYPVRKTRGIHMNACLGGSERYFVAKYQGYEVLLGTYEIRVVDDINNIIYASPSLILNYIYSYDYKPPQSFIDAVMHGPRPNEDKYCKKIKSVIHHDYRFKMDWECPYCGGNHYHSACASSIGEHNSILRIDSYMFEEYNNRNSSTTVTDVICNSCGKLILGGY